MIQQVNKQKKQTLSFFFGLNTILSLLNTIYVQDKNILTITSVLIGPMSWGIAWYLELFIIKSGPKSLEHAKFLRANKELRKAAELQLAAPNLSEQRRTTLNKLLEKISNDEISLLLRESNMAFEEATNKQQRNLLPPNE